MGHAASMPSQRQPRRAPGTIHNVAWNFLGLAAPLIAALAAVPMLIAGLGLERFGVLTLAWAVIGYFSLFDLGLGRALTKLVAQRLADGRDGDNAALIRTALLLLLALGSAAGGLVALCAATLASGVLSVPAVMVKETQTALLVLGATVPVVFLCSALRGVLEAHQRFDIANLIRIPLGLWTFLGPLAVLPLSNRLDHLVLALAAGRVAALIAHYWACVRVRGGGFAGANATRRLAYDLLSFGGWVTISNVVGPLMVYFDRFVIAAMLALAAVAYYTTPYEIVVRLAIVPDAIVGVLFGLFAATVATDREQAVAAFDRGQRSVFFLVFPAVLICSIFAYDGLRLWIGSAFAAESFRAAQWLCAGLLANSIAKVPYAMIQASGRADLTAKLHLIELPLYAIVLLVSIRLAGIEGAAAAWTLRASADMLALLVMVRQVVPELRGVALRALWHFGLGCSVLLAGAALPDLQTRIGFVIIALPAYLCVVWRIGLSAEERSRTRLWIKPLRAT